VVAASFEARAIALAPQDDGNSVLIWIAGRQNAIKDILPPEFSQKCERSLCPPPR